MSTKETDTSQDRESAKFVFQKIVFCQKKYAKVDMSAKGTGVKWAKAERGVPDKKLRA